MTRVTSRAVLVRLAIVAWIVGACTSAGSAGGDGSAAWRSATLVDAASGDPFTIDGFRGQLVVIEPMAVWCGNCRTQQLEAASALARLADPDIVYISITVDPNEREADLVAYAELLGFDWRFAVTTTELARSLATDFGDQVLSPPSTPLILIGPDGEVVDQHYGIRGADDLVALFSRYRPPA